MSSIEYINSVVLTSAQSSVTFSAIPANYNDLMIELQARSDRTTNNIDRIEIQFNLDTTALYSYTYLGGTGSTAVSSRSSNDTQIGGIRMNTSSSSNTSPGGGNIQILSYSNTNIYKTVLTSSNATTESYPVWAEVGLWRSTSAINSIKLFSVYSSNFVAGSTFTLWGVK